MARKLKKSNIRKQNKINRNHFGTIDKCENLISEIRTRIKIKGRHGGDPDKLMSRITNIVMLYNLIFECLKTNTRDVRKIKENKNFINVTIERLNDIDNQIK